MPGPLTQQAIEANSLPLPETWAKTIGLKNYWERVEAAEEEALRQLTPCEVDWSGLDEPDAIPDPDDEEFEAELEQWEGRRE